MIDSHIDKEGKRSLFSYTNPYYYNFQGLSFFRFLLIYVEFFRTELNNFILRSYCTTTKANKNQPLITINLVIIYHVEGDTKIISMWQPYTAMSIPH